MDSQIRDSLTRRRTLGLLAVSAIAGCVGGDTNGGDGDEDQPDGPGTNGGPGSDGESGGSSETSPAGSCDSAYGDTDEPYAPDADSGWVVTFATPAGSEAFYEDSTSRGAVASFGYVEGELAGNYEQTLSVSQRGPAEDVDPDIGGTLADENDRYEDGGTITVDGSERRVAVIRTEDSSVIKTFGLTGPDNGTYRLEVQASVGLGDECPQAYEAVCDRVLDSFERR